MCSDDLTPEQLTAMAETLGRQARYLSKTIERMNKLHWPKDDVLYARAMMARDAAMSLLATLHEVKANNARPRWMRHMSAGPPDEVPHDDCSR
jgi:hypothetical protein